MSGVSKQKTHKVKHPDFEPRIFFISYALAEPVTNVLLKRLTPRVFFTGIILMWGLTMALMGLVTNYAGLLVRSKHYAVSLKERKAMY